jgi:hypothetical protein
MNNWFDVETMRMGYYIFVRNICSKHGWREDFHHVKVACLVCCTIDIYLWCQEDILKEIKIQCTFKTTNIERYSSGSFYKIQLIFLNLFNNRWIEYIL